MKMRFTQDGVMEILLDNEQEKEIFPCIVSDSQVMGDEWVSDSFGPAFGDSWYEDWQRWVQPELQEQFRAQVESIKTFGVVHDNLVQVPKNEVFKWYGAFNQARIVLESVFSFSELDAQDMESDKLLDCLEQWPTDKVAAFHRSRFYTWFQENIMEWMKEQNQETGASEKRAQNESDSSEGSDECSRESDETA